MSIKIPFKRLSDADELLPFDCGDEDLNIFPSIFLPCKEKSCLCSLKIQGR